MKKQKTRLAIYTTKEVRDALRTIAFIRNALNGNSKESMSSLSEEALRGCISSFCECTVANHKDRISLEDKFKLEEIMKGFEDN